MKILAVGDIHLGRRPSRIPGDFPLTPAELSPAVAWRSSCDLAVEEKVAAVLLAGDVVESERDFFEGFRELKAGVDRLTTAGIQVIAVAGNHDVEVLPRLSDAIDDDQGFTLLGRGGTWESHDIESLRIWGWSFPTKEVRASPLDGASFERGSGFELALLHCDLDSSGSPYAPVAQRELDSAGFDAWLLGHIHKPHALSAKSPKGYLGCVSGMDPGEPGPKGPWLMRFDGARLVEMNQVPLAPIQWRVLNIDVSELEDIGALEQLLIAHTEELDAKLFLDEPSPRAVGLRVRFSGQTAFVGELSGSVSKLKNELPHFTAGGRDYFVEHCESALLPRTDLHELAKRTDPLGLLAARLLLLDRPADDSERAELIATAKRQMREALTHRNWHELKSNAEELLDDRIAERLRIAGNNALLRLHTQQQGETA